MFRYRFPVSHRSSVSINTAESNRNTDSTLGNRPTTEVRFLIFPLRFSSQLLVLNLFRWALGSLNTLSPSGIFAFIQEANSEADSAYLVTVSLSRWYQSIADMYQPYNSFLGISTAVTQKLLEQSSPDLTNKVYINVDPILRHAVDQIPVGHWLWPHTLQTHSQFLRRL